MSGGLPDLVGPPGTASEFLSEFMLVWLIRLLSRKDTRSESVSDSCKRLFGGGWKGWVVFLATAFVDSFRLVPA